MAARTNRADFESVFPSLVKDISDHAIQYGLPSTALEWFQNVCISKFSHFTSLI